MKAKTLTSINAAINPFASSKQERNRFNMNAPGSHLGQIYLRDIDREPAPIVSLSVGSAGMARSAMWAQKMTALGCRGRIQSLIAYDCNKTNIEEWLRAATASGIDHLTITPEYLPHSEGFLRQPNAFMSHYGAIERDIERIVDEMERLAHEAGVRPQIIIEWIGFGGHAKLSYLIHEHVAARFPGTQFLPVYCMPDEHVLEQNIRDYQLWEAAEEIIGPIASLITDNRASGSLQILDERIALGLAAMEASYRFRPDVGTMAEIVSMLNLNHSRWVSLDATDLPYRVGKLRRSRKKTVIQEHRMAHSSVVQSIKQAIWQIAAPDNTENHTAFFQPTDYASEQRIYCVLPFTPEVTEEIKNDVEDQLQREVFHGPYTSTKVCFAPGNSLWRRQNGFSYGHIIKLAGLPADPMPQSVERILNQEASLRTSRSRVLARGEAMMRELGMELGDSTPQRARMHNIQEKQTSGILFTHNGDSPSYSEKSVEHFTPLDLGTTPGRLIPDPEDVTPD